MVIISDYQPENKPENDLREFNVKNLLFLLFFLMRVYPLGTLYRSVDSRYKRALS